MWCVSIELPFRILMEGWSFFVVGDGRIVEVYDIMQYEGALYMCMHPPVEILPHFLIIQNVGVLFLGLNILCIQTGYDEMW